LGRSIQLKREVLPFILERFRNSAYLMALAVLLACVAVSRPVFSPLFANIRWGIAWP